MARNYSLPLIALLVWGMLYFSQLLGKPRHGFDGAWLSFSPWAGFLCGSLPPASLKTKEKPLSLALAGVEC